MSKDWFCWIDGEELGPLDAEKITELISAGTLRCGDQIRKGDSDWRAVQSFPKLKLLAEAAAQKKASLESESVRTKKKKRKKSKSSRSAASSTADTDAEKREEGEWSLLKMGTVAGALIAVVVFAFAYAPRIDTTIGRIVGGTSNSLYSTFLENVKIRPSSQQLTVSISELDSPTIEWKAKYLECDDDGVLEFELPEDKLKLVFISAVDCIDAWKKVPPGTEVEFTGSLSGELAGFATINNGGNFATVYEKMKYNEESRVMAGSLYVRLRTLATVNFQAAYACITEVRPSTSFSGATTKKRSDVILSAWETLKTAKVNRDSDDRPINLSIIPNLKRELLRRTLSEPQEKSYFATIWSYEFAQPCDDDFSELVDQVSIENILIDSDQLTDKILETAKQFPNLKVLILSGTKFTSDGLSHLSEYPKLEELQLTNLKNVDDQAVLHIKKLVKLKRLKIDNTSISEDGLDELISALPAGVLEQ